MQPATHAELNKNRVYLRWNGRMRLLLSLLLAVGIMIPLWVLVFAFATEFGQCELQTDGHCHWIMGMDATFMEGEAVPERAVFDDIITTRQVHSYTWTTTWTDSSHVHGYDWLVSFDQAQALHKYYAGQDLNLNLCTVGSNQTQAICNELRYPISPTVTYSKTITVPDDNYISGSYTVWGATLPRIQEFERLFGDRTVTLWANAYITDARIAFYHAWDDANSGFPEIGTGADVSQARKSVVRYTLWFTTTASDVMLEYAAHYALTGDEYVNRMAWGFDSGSNVGLGAGGLYPNGMWHIKDHTIDNGDPTIGSQDNQSKVRVPYLFPIVSTARNSGKDTAATDLVTMTTSANDKIEGTFTFYLCADTTRPYTDTLIHGCTQTVSGGGVDVINVGSVAATYGSKQATATSLTYTPTFNGQYCYLVAFTPTVPSGSYSTYGPSWDTDPQTECFLISDTTRVKLSTFRAVSGSDLLSPGGLSIPLLLIGLCGIAGGLAVCKFGVRGS